MQRPRGNWGSCLRALRLFVTNIIIPTSLRRINDVAFECSLRCPIRLHDGIESIGEYAFCHCILTNFRVPPLITVIPCGMLEWCTATFSVEIPLTVTEIKYYAFRFCHCLRNMAFPPNAVIYVSQDSVDNMRTPHINRPVLCYGTSLCSRSKSSLVPSGHHDDAIHQ